MSISAGKKSSRMTRLAVGLFIFMVCTFALLYLLANGLFTFTFGATG